MGEYIKVAGTIVVFVAASSADAASFSCEKAKGKIESAICADPSLSELDSQLSAGYKEALSRARDAKALASMQKKWIVERNACTDIPCLVTSYRRRDTELQRLIKLSVSACPVDEKLLLGSWVRKGVGDFEEFNLTMDGTNRAFMSWLHHRPELAATWEIKGCVLDIDRSGNPAISYSYKLKNGTQNVLILQPVDDMDRPHTYTRKR